MRLIFCSFIVLLIGCASCTSTKKVTKDFVYFQNGRDSLGTAQFTEPVIQNNDLLSIQVFSGGISQEQALVFNIPNGSTGSASSGASSAGSSSGSASTTGSTGGTTSGYQVGLDGQVEIPIIGKLHATGLTRGELEKAVSRKLDSFGLVKAPFVLVKFTQFKVNVIGDVKSPGPKTFGTDRANIIDAIAASGDLTDEGRRDNIMVIREEKEGRRMYTLDIRSGAMFQSPAFQLHQNDIVYVSPRKLKLRSLNYNPAAQRNVALGVSLISLLTSLASFYLLYNNNLK